jgi:hypothetical protein
MGLDQRVPFVRVALLAGDVQPAVDIADCPKEADIAKMQEGPPAERQTILFARLSGRRLPGRAILEWRRQL